LPNKLTEILIAPETLPALPPSSQSRLIGQARHAALLGHLEGRLRDVQCPQHLADYLRGARIHAEYHAAQTRWETLCLEQALSALPGPVVLLKGAAYQARELGVATGRLASDVDLLLPRAQVSEAESLLLAAGWEHMKHDSYEDHYYRQWMHELPPLQHADRGTVVDLHHSILPLTSRFKPDPAKLLADVRPVEGSSLYTLSPTDNLLHRCAHLFVDGDLNNRLRELVDIDALLTEVRQESDDGSALLARARELDLALPLYYGLYFCNRLLRHDIPQDWLRELAAAAGPGRWITRRLIDRALRSQAPYRHAGGERLAQWLLFVRSHWLRMPPLLLLRHLSTQIWRRGGVKTGQ
jgi:hypothetical protein